MIGRRRPATKKKYKFTSYDLKFRRYLEKKRGSKIPDEEFYKLIQKQKRWLRKFVKAVKKWAEKNLTKPNSFQGL